MANVPYNRVPELLEIRKPSKVRRAVLIALVVLIILAGVFVTIYFAWKFEYKDSHSGKTNTHRPTSPISQQSAGTLEIVVIANY